MKLQAAKRAARQAIQLSEWWTANRPAAPDLFDEELGVALRLLVGTPEAGVSCPSRKRPGLRRLLMPRTRHHVYYTLEGPTGVVHVLAVWSARRGRGPAL